MNAISLLFDFYIRSSLHVSICYVAFYMVVATGLNQSPSMMELIAVGSATFVGYNLAKYAHVIHLSFRYRQWIISSTVLAAVLALVTILKLGLSAIILFSLCSVLTLFYSLPYLLGRSLRQIPMLKLGTIGFCWSILAVLLPQLVNENYEWNHDIVKISLLEILKYGLIVTALCIPFEIRDLKYDEPELRTLPQLIGERWSKIVGVCHLLVAMIIQMVYIDQVYIISMITYIMIAIIALAIVGTNKLKADYYASFFVEALPVIWWLLLVFFI